MNCKSCNTRIPIGQQSCPACGRTARSSAGGSTASREKASDPLPLTERLVKSPSKDAEASSPGVARKSPKPRKAKFRAERPATAASKPDVGPSLFSVNPAELRTLLIDQPELLEPGLCLLSGDSGQSVGARYATDVGEIDLLAVDERGDYVVVMVAERDPGTELIGDLLQRVGWVRKHLIKDGSEVRAIVLTEPLSDEVRYSAAAVAGTVDFKTYRVALTFDDLEI